MRDRGNKLFSSEISFVAQIRRVVEGGTEQVSEEAEVEELIHITALTSDYYHFDAARHQLTGENSGRIYRLGDTLNVTVARVDLDERKIDFVLAKADGGEATSDSKPRGKKPASKSRKPASKARATKAKPKAEPDSTGSQAAPKKPRKKKPKA